MNWKSNQLEPIIWKLDIPLSLKIGIQLSNDLDAPLLLCDIIFL